MKKNLLKNILISVILVIILILPYFVFAKDAVNTDTILGKLQTVAGGTYSTGSSDEYKFAEILGIVVRAFLSLLGIIFIGEILYAGYEWMTARGEEEKITKAKDTLKRSVIGLAIIVGAYAIWFFILDKFIMPSSS